MVIFYRVIYIYILPRNGKNLVLLNYQQNMRISKNILNFSYIC